MCGAFLQLYREEARYLERTAPWVARVGIDYVKQRGSSRTPTGGARCTARFLFSQQLRRRTTRGPSAPPAPTRTNSAPLAEVE